MDIKQCENCGTENPKARYFCSNCGRLLDRQPFSSEELYRTEELKLCRILENLQYTPHTPALWNDTVDVYTRKMERCCAILDLPELKSETNRELRKQLRSLMELCSKPEFQIAFVGTIKTGKSTLINALLGHNYASMAVTPETAALTKFRSSGRDYVKITFYSSQEWEKLWESRTSGADAFMQEYQELNAERERTKWIDHPPIHKELANSEIESELKIWSSSTQAEHYFVKEIEVGISSLPVDFPSQVVFVDTPGLSDPVAYRSEITRDYIRRANAVFVCVDAQKLQKEEIETISTVFSFSSRHKEKVHIIATHWDALNDPEADWPVQKRWMQKRLTGKGFFPDEETARANIMHSAAYIYNLCLNFERLSPKEKRPLRTLAMNCDLPDDSESIRESLDQLMDLTNIGKIRRVLVDELANQYSKLLWDEIREKYLNIQANLKRAAQEGLSAQQNFIEATGASIAEMEQKVREQQENYEEISQCRKQLVAAMEMVDRSTKKRMEAILDQFKRLSSSKKDK